MISVLMVALAVGLAVIAAAAGLVARSRRAAVLRRAGFGLMASSTFMFAAFLAGETFSDPGGWAAAGLVAAWAAPLTGLALLSWLRPGWAVSVLAALAAAVLGVSIWFALDPGAWRSFEDRNGPIRAVITFVLAAAVAVLGLRRTSAAGILLLVVGVVPAAVSYLGGLPGFGSLLIVSAAPVVTGTAYVLAAHLSAPPGQPRGVRHGRTARPAV